MTHIQCRFWSSPNVPTRRTSAICSSRQYLSGQVQPCRPSCNQGPDENQGRFGLAPLLLLLPDPRAKTPKGHPTHTMRRFSMQQCTLLSLRASRSMNSTSVFVVWSMISFRLRSSAKLPSLKSVSREYWWITLTSPRTSNSNLSYRV